LSRTVFLSLNFGPRYSRKSIKDSNDSDDSLVSKKSLSQKLAYWVGTQGQVNLAKKAKISPQYDFTPENPKPKTKNVFFFNLNYKTCWIRRGYEQRSALLLNQSVGEVWWCKALQKKWRKR